MNTKSILSVSLVMLLVIGGASAWAQGRSRSNGHDNHHGSKGNANHNNDHKDRNHHNNSKPQYSYHDHDRGHHDHRNYSDHHDHRRVVHVYHPAPVERRVVHHYYHHERPRYVYYRDYDVYYDCHRNVYISFGSRNWSVSAGIPVAMRHVDVRTVVTTNVDYYDDNFTAYLDSRRPGGRLYAEW